MIALSPAILSSEDYSHLLVISTWTEAIAFLLLQASVSLSCEIAFGFLPPGFSVNVLGTINKVFNHSSRIVFLSQLKNSEFSHVGGTQCYFCYY